MDLEVYYVNKIVNNNYCFLSQFCMLFTQAPSNSHNNSTRSLLCPTGTSRKWGQDNWVNCQMAQLSAESGQEPLSFFKASSESSLPTILWSARPIHRKLQDAAEDTWTECRFINVPRYPDNNVYYCVILQISYNIALPLFIQSAGEEELSISSFCQLRTKMNLLAQMFWYS